jgi:hypothetical protein
VIVPGKPVRGLSKPVPVFAAHDQFRVDSFTCTQQGAIHDRMSNLVTGPSGFKRIESPQCNTFIPVRQYKGKILA